MQRMLEPFMHLVASFGGGNGIDVYKKQTCTVQGWQINTNQLAFPQIVQTHKFKTFRAFRIRAVIRWRLADPTTGFKFCKTTQPGSWRNNCGALHCCWSSLLKSRCFLFSLAGARWFSWCHVCTWKRARKSQRILPGEPFSQAKQHSFLFFGTDFVITHYGAKWNSHTTRSAQDLLSACR